MLAEKRSYGVESSYTPAEVQTVERVRHSRQQKPQFTVFNRLSMFSCIILCGAVAWTVVTMGSRINSTNYGIYRLQSQLQKIAATNADLTSQVDKLSQPSRILEVAQNRLHMTYQNPVQIASGSASTGH